MRTVKVMAVDDEILALDYIERLLPWEKTQYRLIAKAADAREAVRLFQRLKPTIMIVDISMPNKNGITLMKEILEFGIPVKFIFLTAYREFQYVQEALRLGASGYVLKHDLQAEMLLHELDKAAASLSMELKNRDLQVNRESGYHRQLIAGVVSPDRLYPVIGNGDLEVYAPPAEPVRCMDFSLYQAIDYVEIADTAKNKFFLSVYLKDVYRYAVLSEELRRLSREIQQIFKEYTSRSVSIAFAFTPCGQYQKKETLQRLESLIEQRFFLGVEQTLYLEENRGELLGEPVPPGEVDQLFEKLRKGREPEKTLKEVFQRAKGSVAGFDALVRMLVAGINRQRAELGMPSLYELDQMGVLNRELWRDFQGVQTWFLDQFQLLSKELSVHNQGESSSKARQAVHYIERSYDQDIGVESIAAHLGISGVYLIKIFKQETGKTVTEYLTEYRMEVAKKLILEKRWKIYDLAQRVGYHSAQYFSTVFKKYTGLTPQEYRGQNKGVL